MPVGRCAFARFPSGDDTNRSRGRARLSPVQCKSFIINTKSALDWLVNPVISPDKSRCNTRSVAASSGNAASTVPAASPPSCSEQGVLVLLVQIRDRVLLLRPGGVQSLPVFLGNDLW